MRFYKEQTLTAADLNAILDMIKSNFVGADGITVKTFGDQIIICGNKQQTAGKTNIAQESKSELAVAQASPVNNTVSVRSAYIDNTTGEATEIGDAYNIKVIND